jgi:hypothetical protein
MSDIFDKLNRPISSVQGPNTTVFQPFHKVSAFMKNMLLWKSLCESDTLEMFVNMSAHLEVIITYLNKLNLKLTDFTNLESNFKNHFPQLTLQQHEWIQNPLTVTTGEKISHTSIKAKEFATLKIKFQATFWIYI